MPMPPDRGADILRYKGTSGPYRRRLHSRCKCSYCSVQLLHFNEKVEKLTRLQVILYLSYFYKSKELPIRLSFFWGSYVCTSIVGAFLAYGILHLKHVTGWAGWRWLFALEGALTALIGITSWYVIVPLSSGCSIYVKPLSRTYQAKAIFRFYLPPSPTQTASRFRGKNGCFTEREEIVKVNRVLRDDPSKGDMHNRQGLSFTIRREALPTTTYGQSICWASRGTFSTLPFRLI